MSQSQKFPFHLSLMKVNYAPPRVSDYFTLFLMLSGSMVVTLGEKVYQLGTDDILVINPRQQFQIKSTEKNLLLSLRISRTPMTAHFKENWLPYIACSSSDEKNAANDEKFQQLREALAHLMAVYFKQKDTNELEIYQHFFTVLTQLVKGFKKEVVPDILPLTSVADERLKQVLDQIQKDYDQPLSLETLAASSGISYYHLSRSFKKQLGITFTEYLTQIRLMHAAEALVLTSYSVIQVALNSGFSNTKTLHQVFKKQYGLTPANYRRKYALANQQRTSIENADYQEITGALALQELSKYLVEKDIEDENAAIEERLELVMPDDRQTDYHKGKQIIKIGLAREGLANGVQRELRILQKDLAFDLVQFEGFCEETNFENDVLLVSEYILNNQWFDFLMSIQLKPMIQLYIPESYQTREDVQSWCDKQLKIIRHFLNRYGQEEVEKWYMQWSLPKETGDWCEESCLGYQYFYRKLKQLVPDCKLGVMSLRSLDEKEYEQYRAFMSEQARQLCLPDFITFHADPYASTLIKDEYALQFKKYQKAILNKVTEVITANQMKSAFSMWNPEIFLTDWNTLVGEGNTFTGTFFRSALILEAIIALSKEVTGIAYWLNIKVKERQTHMREDGSLSVFLYEELRRPLYFSLRFLTHLKGEMIASGDGYLLTRHQGQYQLLLYNSSSNSLDPLHSIDSVQVQYQMKKMKVCLKALPIGDYLVREYVLDKDHGGIYNDWIRVGGQSEIDQELQKYLEQKIMPKFELYQERVDLTGYTIETTLTLNACQLYLLQPIY